jgi:hypothetical protein
MIEVKRVDTVTVKTPIPASLSDTETFVAELKAAADAGYALSSASALEGGNQRDPYTIGLVVTFLKP